MPPTYAVILLEADPSVVHLHNFLDRTHTFQLERRCSAGAWNALQNCAKVTRGFKYCRVPSRVSKILLLLPDDV